MTNNKKEVNKKASFNYKYVLLVLLLSLFIPSFYKVNKKVTEKVQDIIEEVIYIPSSPVIETTDEGWTTETVVKIKKDAASRHGISYYEYCVREDEDFSKCEWQKTDTKNIIVSKTGIYNVVFRAVNSKNKHSKLSNVIKVYIDNEAPEITSDSLKLKIHDTKVDVSINANDKNSGLGEITYSLDGTNFELLDPINGITGLKPNTEYDLYIKVSDKLGNSKVLKKTLKTTKKGALPIDEAGNEITDDPSVNPGTDNKPEEVDSFIPEISLSDVPMSINFGDSYILPTSYKFGKSGGTVTCTVDDMSITNTSQLSIGNQEVICTAQGNNGISTTVSKYILVGYQPAENETWDGYITLNLYYPPSSTNRMWRLNVKNTIRDGENDSEWTNYTGPITVRMEDVGNVYIKYDLNDKEIIDTKGDALVDIRPNSYYVYSFDKTKVSITFDKDAETKEYRINGGDWVTYTEPFFASANSLIEAKVTKIVNTYDKFGDLIKSKTITNTDSVYIHERDWTVNQIFGKVDINITATPSSVVDDEKSTIIISYQSDSENRVYRINGGAWISYTEPFEVGKNTIIEAYATATREVTTADGSKYSGNTDGSARVKVYDGADYHDYSVSLSGNTNIDVTETSKIYVSTDHNLQALSYSINGGEYVSTQARSYAYYQIATLGVNDTITVKAEYLANDNKTKIAYDSLTVGENKNGLRLSITAPDNVIDNANAPITIYANYPTKTLEYRVNGGEWTTYTGSFNVLNNTLVEARATKENSDGSEQSVFKSKYVKTTPLSVSVSSSDYYVYVDDTATITISSNYPNAILYYSYDDVTYNRYYQPLSVIGGTKVYGKAEYRDSNNDLQVAKSSTKVVLVNNLTGPSITSSNTSTTTKPVTITLNTEFDGDIYYSIDNGPWIAYQNPFEISKNSLIKAYYVRESDGLTSKTTSYRITNIRNEDLPTITINANPNDPNTLVDEVTISISAHDYDILEYSLDNVYFQNYTGSFKISDNHTIYARAKNYNGWSYSQLVVNNVNPIKPVTLASNITINPTKQNSNNSVNEVIATLTYDERATSRLYKLGSDDDWHEYTEPLHITRNTTIYLYETDDLRGTGSNSKRIDFLPEGIVDPIITSSPDVSVPANEVSISISYDVIATVKKYRIDNGLLQDYEGPITIDTNNTTIYAYSEDINGQVADASYVVSNITTVTNLVLDQGSYYLIKLNYPTTGKIIDKEYKMENGDWKPYPNDGILLIKPEYQDQVLNNNGVLIIDIVDENGDTINFNGDHYVIDDNISQIVTSISLRWNTLPPDTPTFDAEETGWTSNFELTINYPDNMLQKQYRVVYPDGTNTGWLSYDKPLSIDDNVTVYARCQDEIEVWSDVGEFNVTNIDKTNPTISNTELTQAGTNFLTFNVTATDNESGVKYYYYSTDGEAYSVAMNKNIKFNGLTANTEYTLYFYVQDNVGNRSEVVTATGMTSQIAKPIVTFEPSADTWSTSKRVLISHEDTLMTLYYSKDNGNTWEEYTEEVVLTENGSIIAKASDGTNERLSDLYTINKIDTTAPSVTNITYAGRSSRLIVNATASDNESGIDHFLYSLDGITYTEDDESYSFTNLKANTDHTIYVKAVNKAGLESEARSTSAHTNDIAEISYSVTDADVWAYTKTVTINYPTEEDGTYTNQYSLNGGNTWVNYTEPILIETEGVSIIARVLDGTQNTKVASTLQIAKIDRTEPTISLDGVPSEFASGDNVTIPTSYTYDENKSGGTLVCESSVGGEFSKISDLEGGYQTITCTVTTGAGRTATVSKAVTVVKLESRRGESILDILNDNTLKNNNYYSFIVETDDETVTYSVHMIVLDGNQTITEDTRYGDLGDCASGTTEDEMAKRMVIVKVNGDYTINSNVTVGPTYHEQYGGPKGFMLYVTGKLTNNGTIDQSHGAYAYGDNVYLWKNELTNDYEYIPAVGAEGVASGATGAHNGVDGIDGIDAGKRALASGGTGVSDNNGSAGRSGNATSYSGGTGSGSAFNCTSENANNYGGIGGQNCGAEAGGAGNPGGAGGGTYPPGQNGTGGLLIIKSNTFENNGLIRANGYNGGQHTSKTGGSSGGGSINIFIDNISPELYSSMAEYNYGNILGNTSTSGGSVTGSKFSGGAGGTGTVNIGTVFNDQYYDLGDHINNTVYTETLTGDSILDVLNNNTSLSPGFYKFKMNDLSQSIYYIHLIKLDGNQVITENTVYGEAFDVASGLDEKAAAKNMVIVLVDGDYTVNEGVTIGPFYNEYGGPKGFMLYVTGTLTNNGIIENSHGAYARGENVYLWKNAETDDYEMIPAVGGNGGTPVNYKAGNPGDDGISVDKRALAGGGAGGGYNSLGGYGGSATSYSGGTGGGAGGRATGENGSNLGGKGGDAIPLNESQYGGGGAGNPGGAHSYGTSYNGENGTGGLLIVYASTLNNSNEFIASGSNGGQGADSSGGASGGGSINVFYDNLLNKGILTVNGGTSTGKIPGGAGGTGTVNVGTIIDNQYYDVNDVMVQLVGDSILGIMDDNPNITSGLYQFKIVTENDSVSYPVRLIVLDGNQTITEDTRYGSLEDCASGTTEDLMAKRMVIVKVNGDYTINEGVTVGPTYHEQYGGPKGFMLYVTGKLTNNGTIDQSHGAYAYGDNVYLWKNELTNDYEMIPAVGGAGGMNKGESGQAGAEVSKRALGGGSAGGSRGNAAYVGTAATSYSGGTGGAAYSLTAEASPYGGAGGSGYIAGAGNPGGTGKTSSGQSGTGGLLLIYSNEFENNGIMTSEGKIGRYDAGVASGGGASGGGSINIFTNQITNANITTNINDKYNNIIGENNVNGGAASGQYGVPAGAGTINIGEIRNGQYYDLKDIIQQDINIYAESIAKSGESIIDILNDNPDLTEGYWNFKVATSEETIVYPVHLIVLDGNQTITEDTRYGSLEDCASGTTEDKMATAMVIVKVNGDYTINEGVTVGPVYHEQYGGPKGFMLYVTGKLTNNGTIDQSHGAYAYGDNVYLWKNELTNDYEMIPAVGGAGGMKKGESGQAGAEVSKRALGGGSAGESRFNSGYAGGSGTSYSGGTGGAAYSLKSEASQYGGTGGEGYVGGAGNPGGYGNTGSGLSGTGGLLIIFSDEYENNGTIISKGNKGAYNTGVSSGGGASGEDQSIFLQTKLQMLI